MNTAHKQTLAVLTCMTMILGLVTGCAQSTPGELDSHFTFWQEVPEEAGGGKVLCVWAKQGSGAGTSCDWQGYHQKYDRKAQ